MFSYNLDSNEFFGGFGIILFIVLFIIGGTLLYVFSSLGLMKLAKNNNLKNAWLAFIPIGYNALIGTLGFEIYPDKNEKKPTLTWILIGLSASTVILGDSLSSYISIAVTVFVTMAYYRIYKFMVPESAVKYTILSFFFGGLPLYFNKKIIKAKEEVVTTTPKFCTACGNKLESNAKFCNKCGQKIN